MNGRIFILGLFIPFYSFPQNLIVNGGFEEENICTEYQVNCAPEGWISSTSDPGNYIKSSEIAYAGSHCMIVEAGRRRGKFERSYIRTPLLCALRPGNQYRLNFYLRSGYDILDSAGFCFSTSDFLFDRRPLHRVDSALYVTEGNRVEHGDTGWQKFSIVFTAKGTEKFLVFANFSKRDINGETGNAGESQFTIYIDEVSLMPVDPAEKICPDWEKARDEIYNFNDRHEFLDRLVRFYRTQNKKPPIPKLSLTRIVKADTLILPEVLFGVAKYNLQKQADRILDSFCLSLHNRQVDSIIVEGHTDSTGDRQFNSELSLQRAKAVSRYISDKAKGRELHMTVRSWGAVRPVASNRNPAGRRKNRRVEVLLFIQE